MDTDTDCPSVEQFILWNSSNLLLLSVGIQRRFRCLRPLPVLGEEFNQFVRISVFQKQPLTDAQGLFRGTLARHEPVVRGFT
jgi:hypothetical protein